MSCGLSHGQSVAPQAMVDQRPVFDNGRRHKTVYSRKAGIYRPTKKRKKVRFF